LLFGALVVVAVGCSNGGNSPTPASTEVTATQCGRAAGALNNFKTAGNFLNQDGMVQATDAMRKISSGTPSTDLSQLVDATVAAMTPMIDSQQGTGDLSATALEYRRAASALGLWCIDHSPPDASADLAQRFVRGS